LSAHDAGEQPDVHFHVEGDAAVLETQIQRIEREQREAKQREESYTKRQVAINDQQLRVNRWLMRFTGLLLVTSLATGLLTFWEAKIAQKSANAADSSAKTAAYALRESEQQFKQTLKEMQAQSQAMQESADSEVSTNRAWMVPDAPPHNKRTIEEANLEWHNAGKTPAIAVFSTTEYFIGEFPHQLRTCVEMERKLKKQPMDIWQYEGFIAESGRYETGLAHIPAWVGQQPISIHGCVWYTDIVSNTEKSTEFFLQAFQNKFAFPSSEGVSLFYLSDRPLIYK
jgi:hypothetical protein